MLCVLSLIVFSFLGIFFARYRELAKEAFRCVSSRARTGDCDTDFETEMRASIIGWAMERDSRLASFLNDHLEKLAWLMLILLFLSGIFLSIGIFNWVAYGNCSGPGAEGGCAFDHLTPEEGFVGKLLPGQPKPQVALNTTGLNSTS